MTEEVVNILTKEKNIYRKSWKESFYCYSELGTHQKVLGKVIIPSNFFPPNRTTWDDVLSIDYKGNKQRGKLDKKLL